MKNYLRLSVALGLLFFSLPTLAMEDITWNSQGTKAHAPPAPEALSLNDDNTRLNRILGEKFLQTEASDPFLASKITLNFNVPPEVVEMGCDLLSGSLFKNLQSINLVHGPLRFKGSKREFTEEDMNQLASLLSSRAETVESLEIGLPFNKNNAKTLTEILPNLKKLNYLKVFFHLTIDNEERKDIINAFPSLPNLQYLRLDGAHGEPECTAVTQVLPKLPNLKGIIIGGKNMSRGNEFNCFFNDDVFGKISKGRLRNEIRLVDGQAREQLEEAFKAHPNAELLWAAVQ